MQIVAADIGGTHARFAVADLAPDGAITMGEPTVLATGDYPGPAEAWEAFEAGVGHALPRAISIAAAGPVRNHAIVLTNNRWTIAAAELREQLRLERITLINDFGAVAHAAAISAQDQFTHIAGPDQPLPGEGTITVIGPGTGLGIAHFQRKNGHYRVQPTEGGHIGFAPQDELDDRILADLRKRHGRVVSEHVVAGPGIAPIYAALGGSSFHGDRAIWTAGLACNDPIASAAIDRFCASLGSAAGDYALAQGASAVVLAGAIVLKLRDRLPASDFAARFTAKPRYEDMMADMPIKLLTDPQPGLLGAAAAFAAEHGLSS